VLDLLDDMFEQASLVDEPTELNFIKKHTDELRDKGVDRPYSRLFSNPPGDFGSMVNEQIGSGDWSSGEDLGNTWEGRNSFSYGRQKSSVGAQSTGGAGGFTASAGAGVGASAGATATGSDDLSPATSGTGATGGGGQSSSVSSRTSSPIPGGAGSGTRTGAGSDRKVGSENGQFRPEVLTKLLSTTDRIVQEIDSVEYGLTDIQEYYANTGAIKKAAENKRGGRRVGVSVIETFEKNVRPRELEETLRMEYRSKLLNPKWAEAMAGQGAGGAYEISGRMTAMIGWAATTDFAEKWVSTEESRVQWSRVK
jgi:cobalamin biosynthesis Mg chelatase CobN